MVGHKVNKLCEKFSNVFNVKGDGIAKAKNFIHEIVLKPHTAPVYVKQYRLPPAHRETIAEKVREMLDQDLIEPSYSVWNAPVLLVPKKDSGGNIKEYRMVIDYRKLNVVIKDDKFPIPNIDDILDGLGKPV